MMEFQMVQEANVQATLFLVGAVDGIKFISLEEYDCQQFCYKTRHQALFMVPPSHYLALFIASCNTPTKLTPHKPNYTGRWVEMETAIGTAHLLVHRVLAKLSDEFVAAFAASTELGLDSQKIKNDLMYTEGLLHAAQGRGIGNNPGLQGLLTKLSSQADQAEIALDELHYFIIKDQIDGTHYAVPDLGDGIQGHAIHGRHAIRHTIGNLFAAFSFSPTIDEPQNETKPDSGSHVDEWTFDRVAMSNKIKSVIEGIHSMCDVVSKLLSIIPHSSTNVTLKRPLVGSNISQDRLYGRTDIFQKTIGYITSCRENLSVLPIVGPGGIGKSTLTQHMYNDTRAEEHFSVRVWISASTEFDVLNLTKQILLCMPATEEEESNTAHETGNLANIQLYIAHRLRSKRFLVVLDDVWHCKHISEWEHLLAPFTKGEAKGSMILVTTRFPRLAEMMKTVDPLELQGLEPNDFFTFFEACIFGELDRPEGYTDILSGIARKTAYKLAGNPLAAKTVSRLLRKDISQEHWMGVLENKAWQHRQNDDDIMSSLNTSYDYLPFLLQKCFSYYALYPKGHRFTHLEMNRFFTTVGIIDSTHQGHENYLEELVDNGFLVKAVDLIGEYYIMDNLLHDLSLTVSAQECLNISGLDFKADIVPRSIRHLSITLEDIYDEKFLEEMSKLKTRIDIASLRTLMIFRQYEGEIVEILKDMFKELNDLHVLFIVVKSLDDLPQNFSKLIHLQYLKLGSPYGIDMALPSTMSRFHHLKFLDLEDWHGSFNLTKDISRLVNLQNFLAKKELHSSIPEVGMMKCLEELKEFCVKKESVGFELRELGELAELGGELRICNLETVATKKEASEARLISKRNLGALTLVWGKGQQDTGSDILDGLQPHSNLRALGIVNHGGTAGPSWLSLDISVKMLESFHLEGISWGTLQPFGQLLHLKELSLKSISGMRQLQSDYGFGEGKSFIHLKKIVFDDMPELEEWVVVPDSQLLPSLESIECRGCPNLYGMPFSSCPNLCSVLIDDCPKLYLLPMPVSSTVSVVESSSRKLTYSQKVLIVRGCNGALDFRNLDGSVVFSSVQNEEHVQRVIQFPSPSSLQTLGISGCAGMVIVPAGEGREIQDMESLESVTIFRCGKLFSEWPMGEAQTIKPFPASLKKLGISSESSIQSLALLSNLMSLTHLTLQDCVKLTVDGFNPLITVNLKVLLVFNSRWDRSCPESVAADLLSEVASSTAMPAGSFQLEQLKVDSISAVLAAPICNLVAYTLHTLIFCHDHRVKSFTEEQEKALQLLTSLRHLGFDGCGALQSLPRGLSRISSLEDLELLWCPEIQSIPKEGFPVSLRNLCIRPCSTKVKEQIEELRRTSPGLSVRYE